MLFATLDYWYYDKKVNVIPINAKTKKPNGVNWFSFKTNRIPKELFEKWKRDGLFDNGFAIILGRTYSDEEALYLIGIDCDSQQAIKEFSTIDGELKPLEKLVMKFMVENHQDDSNSLHIYFFSPIPFPTKGADTNLGLEVKGSAEGSGYMVSSPTMHPNGYQWEILGTTEPPKLTRLQAIEMLNHIDTICRNYGLDYLDKKSGILSSELKAMIKKLKIDENSKYTINEGGRHSTLVSIANSILFRHLEDGSNLDKLRDFFEKINEKFCYPDSLPGDEIRSIWDSSIANVKQNKDFTFNNKHNSKQTARTYSTEYKTRNESIEEIGEPYLYLGAKPTEKEINKLQVFEKISDKNIVQYVNNIAKKTIKQEDSLIRLLFYTGMSTYTQNPLNLGIIAPTSEGKTYPVTEMTKFLPSQDVWTIGSMSPKVIIRDRGIMVDENNEPIEQIIQDLTEQIKKAQKSGNTEEENDLNQQLKEIHKNSKVLIDLSGKVLVFLEPPHKETWDILKPILSHDTYEIEHPYVYKTETKGMEVKHIVTRGWPACIF